MVRMMCVLALLMFVGGQAHAIDSLLKKGAKEEKERVKKASKSKAAAILTLKGVNESGEVVATQCVWLARIDGEYYYQRVTDGKLIHTKTSDVAKVEGDVLDHLPQDTEQVHMMYCNGIYGEPCISRMSVPAWPSPSVNR